MSGCVCTECILNKQIVELESERDKALQEARFNGQIANARLAEIDRLKAELEINQEARQAICKDRDLWKSKYEQALKDLAMWEGAHGLDAQRNLWKSKAEKLAEALRGSLELLEVDGAKHNIWRKALAEFGEGK